MRRVLATIFTLIAFMSYSQIDTATKSRYYDTWVNLGFQNTISDKGNYLGGVLLGVTFPISAHICFRTKGHFSLSPYFVPSKENITPNALISVACGSLLCGYVIHRTSSLMVFTGLGASCGYADYRGGYLGYSNSYTSIFPSYVQDKYSFIGLPLDLSIVNVGTKVGISFDLFANIHKHSEFGIAVSMCLGSVRH